jgi:hypothetical protein
MKEVTGRHEISPIPGVEPISDVFDGCRARIERWRRWAGEIGARIDRRIASRLGPELDRSVLQFPRACKYSSH